MDDPALSPEPPATRSPARDAILVAAVGLFLIAAFVLGSHLLRPRNSVLDRATGGRLSAGPYAGSRVCAECHPGEHAHFTGSGHARAFRKAAESKIARRLVGRQVADPELPGVTWTYGSDGGKLFADRPRRGRGRGRSRDTSSSMRSGRAAIRCRS